MIHFHNPESQGTHSVPEVLDPTILQFEHESHDNQALFRQLSGANKQLALWLRRRAEALEPNNLIERGRQARLALELYALLDNQGVIDDLNERYNPGEASLPTSETLPAS